MLRAFLILCLALVAPLPSAAQTLQDILQTHQAEVAMPSRRTIGPVLEDLAASGLSGVAAFLEAYAARQVYIRDADGLFFSTAEAGNDQLTLFDLNTGAELETVSDEGFSVIRPNGGVRREIGSALVQFQLSDPDITRRQTAVDAIARSMSPDQLPALRGAIDNEPDPELKAVKERLAGMLAARFGDTTAERVAAIEALSGDLSVDVRAVLNQILSTETLVSTALPDRNIARILDIGTELTTDEAYQRLVNASLASARISPADIRTALSENIVGGRVGSVSIAQLATDEGRDRAYTDLAANGVVPPFARDAEIETTLARFTFFEVYDEADATVTDAARLALDGIETRVAASQFADLGLDALSLASIYFLAAIGLAITFGVMGVINMAHGEFIMMGAYMGYVVQLFVPDYTLSIIVALPLAFAITFGAGVAMERTVIRWLYHRPLETLLATFGISIALQQLAKNIFGTQARPLTSPEWLDGALVFNDVIAISYIRIAIFVLALLFLALILLILKRTRLGLEVRAVTQNPGMAASMGINPDRINMLTFGLGSGVAGIAGVAIGLYAKVTSEMGADYIVQSFMTVVVGGVGNVWGTLAGATLIGGLQKGIEWFNPSNTLAAQTYMILFIILFIQFRPKGIVALKGRAAGD